MTITITHDLMIQGGRGDRLLQEADDRLRLVPQAQRSHRRGQGRGTRGGDAGAAL